MEVHGFNKHGSIDITIDEMRMSVPDDMSNRHRRMIAEWEAKGNVIAPYTAPAPTTAEVKAEANRRIVAIMPEYTQRNVMALALETMQQYGTDPAQWPAPLKAINDATMTKWASIKTIRTKSDQIEAMSPIPSDFKNDSYWV